MEPTGKDLRRYIAAAFAAAAVSTPPAAPSRAEAQSVRPRVDFNESAERARALRRSGARFDKRLPGERFQLFNDCEPVTVGTPNLSLFTDAGVEADMAAMQRTAARIRRTAETRFGNAGVLAAEARGRGWFGIRIAGSPDDFDARASFEKVVIDLATGEVAFTGTYSLVGLGGRGRINPTPEAMASDMIDLFLTDYLAANADACAERDAR